MIAMGAYGCALLRGAVRFEPVTSRTLGENRTTAPRWHHCATVTILSWFSIPTGSWIQSRHWRDRIQSPDGVRNHSKLVFVCTVVFDIKRLIVSHYLVFFQVECFDFEADELNASTEADQLLCLSVNDIQSSSSIKLDAVCLLVDNDVIMGQLAGIVAALLSHNVRYVLLVDENTCVKEEFSSQLRPLISGIKYFHDEDGDWIVSECKRLNHPVYVTGNVSLSDFTAKFDGAVRVVGFDAPKLAPVVVLPTIGEGLRKMLASPDECLDAMRIILHLVQDWYSATKVRSTLSL